MRLLVTLAATLPLIACTDAVQGGNDAGVPASGTGNARVYQVSDFTDVASTGADDVDVRVGTGFSVRAEGPSEALEHLKIERDGNTLRIGRDRSGFNWQGPSAKVFVTMPRLVAASAAGSGDMAIDRVEGSSFSADGTGSGSISIGAVAVERATFSLAGSGEIAASGTARGVKVDLAGSGDFDARGLRASGAEVSVAGSGNVALRVDGDARVSVVGSGDVDLGPNARCNVSQMGSGTVRCAR